MLIFSFNFTQFRLNMHYYSGNVHSNLSAQQEQIDLMSLDNEFWIHINVIETE
jgi:hypothetical protein